jgi:hypothetical protein
MQPEAVAIFRSLGIHYYNTREKIPADRYPKEWNIHFMHPSAEGHRVFGEALEEELQTLGWLVPRLGAAFRRQSEWSDQFDHGNGAVNIPCRWSVQDMKGVSCPAG